MKLYGVIGNPIAQSMSPIMHNQEFQQLGIQAYYHPFHILEKDLETAIKGMKVMGINGINVTSPHKETIIPLLDYIDPLAEAIGAVNTVARLGNEFHGFNTDGEGYMKSLQSEWKEDIFDERTLIIGAGGAAKAIYYTFLSLGMKRVDICNRSVDRAEKLIAECPYDGSSHALSLQEAEEHLANYDLIIQTTTIGMYPQVKDIPLSLERLRSDTFVSDIIYNPIKTKFLTVAEQKGAKIHNGVGMFVHQGALAFEKWTGIQPNINRMTNIVLTQLGG